MPNNETPVVTKADVLRNQALAARNKSGNRMGSAALRVIVTEFLNSDESYIENVEKRWPAATKPNVAVSRLKAVIKEDGLDTLVYPIVTPDGCTLVKIA